jgi:esterase/lipase superfamily enzyme
MPDSRWVSLLFATTRRHQEDGFSGERNDGAINLGKTAVRIPESHEIGKIERPLKFTLFNFTVYREKYNQNQHFTAGPVSVMSESEWVSHIQSFGVSDCLLFIHGFNTSFQDSVFRFAQIVFDLRFDGLPILFSWPSRAVSHDYLYDRDSALGAAPQLVDVLQKVGSNNNIERIHILAHSMGNFCLLHAVAFYLDRLEDIHIGEVIMAAPDIDRDLYKERAKLIRPRTSGMTLYASAADRALAICAINLTSYAYLLDARIIDCSNAPLLAFQSAQFHSTWWKFGAPGEIRTPDP